MHEIKTANIHSCDTTGIIFESILMGIPERFNVYIRI